MSDSVKQFCEWVEREKVENGLLDIKFYPKNPTNSTPDAFLEEAWKMVSAWKDGHSVPYEDPAKGQLFSAAFSAVESRESRSSGG